jgi:small subunit ribosomal protein S6
VVSRTTKTTRGKKGTSKTAPQAKEKLLRDYEMVVIINPELDEDKFTTILNNINKLIDDMGGVVADIKQWGKRKLAYPIKKFSEGNYVLTQFQLQPALSKEVEAKLQISEDVLRHLLVRLGS